MPTLRIWIACGVDFYLCSGYLSDAKCELIYCVSVRPLSVTLTADSEIICSMSIHPCCNLSVQSCKLIDELNDRWRIAYPGDQVDISVARRPRYLSTKLMDVSVMFNILHRMTASQLVKTCTNGRRLTFVIYSRDFEFYRLLCIHSPPSARFV